MASSMSNNERDVPTAKRMRVGERTMLACNNCKQRKLKCDAQIPICKNCAKAERECLVEDPATGLHRPRDYIRSLETQSKFLEERVSYLESVLKETRPDVALDHLDSDIAVPNLENSPVASVGNHRMQAIESENPRTGHARPDAGAQGADGLSDEVALLCLGAAGREPQYFGPSSALSFSRIASSVMGLPRQKRATSSQPSISNDRPSNVRQLETVERSRDRLLQVFPSPHKMSLLSQAYFENIHLQYPFLHRQTILSMEKHWRDSHARGDLSQVEDVSVFFLLMVYAIGSLALGKHEVDNAEACYTAALEFIVPILEMDSLQSIQAILCCAVYSIRSPIGDSLWKLSGMAIRHCVELGYHRSTKKYRPTADALTREMSKRCFWVAYDIDRVASFILGRPVGIADSSIDVELPADIDDEHITSGGLTSEPRNKNTDPPTCMTLALHAIRLRQLWSKFSDVIYANLFHPNIDARTQQVGASIESLRQDLEEWKALIPSVTGDCPHGKTLSVFASRNWFSLAYDYSILLLYRHYIVDSRGWYQGSFSPSQVGIMDARDRAFEVCTDHARNICLMYRHLYQTEGASVQFTWGSLHILFMAGLTYLYCIWRSPCVRQRTKPNAVMNTSMACTTVLIIIADRWPSAIPYRDIFETLSERTVSMICEEQANQHTGGTIFSGADGVGATEVPPAMNQHARNGLDNITGTENIFDNFGVGNGMMPAQEWITALDDIEAPGDSQWLAQELFQGLVGDSSFTM
ncbi:hypothetical protein BU24DRAFT_468668 [Aaosphaeria arxii CBS 175.79]|uniref:Zn(2)-C6 fungal-type domain-containing protein n=1 Tax=Aaosphaeria arxii CBS 175.79 TaxID=1450172 RepID=A0A6A5X804_9PLEO|nr:uncharacterized protein BU24DRAFT_468668 [Aaosphaeria arxii CBS 175.79]KAF2008884.1 hypothetical protein BU24DRAFT_468668 [Aaosphaeria arxii CBS 175.79]